MTSYDTKDMSCVDDWHATGAFRPQEYGGVSESQQSASILCRLVENAVDFFEDSSSQQALHLEQGTRRGLPQGSAYVAYKRYNSDTVNRDAGAIRQTRALREWAISS
jgi:hypothetical protein